MKALLTLCLVGLALVTSPAQSAFVNFEPSLVHPIAVTPNGLRLLALDPPNATLQVWSLASPDDPVPLVSIPVGLEPVSLAVRDDDEIWVVESLSDSISVVSISGQRVVATIPMKDDPADVVFAGTPQRAFVSVAGSDEVRVVDPQTHQVVGQVSIPGKEPRALAVNATGSSVYALVFRSGNRTTLVPAGLLPPPFPTRPGLPLAPPQSRVVSLDDPAFAAHPMNLPDIDLVEIDATTLGITNTIKGIGTINFDLAHDPTLDALWVVSTDARNRFAFEPVVRGRFLESRLSRIDLQPSRPPRAFDLHAHFDHFNIPNAPDRATALAEPVSVVVDDVLGRVFIASQGSDRLGVLDRQGNILARIELSTAPLSDRDTPNKRGPRGLARHPTHSRLYVYHRLSHSIAVVDTLALTVVTEKSLGFDPTPAIIRDGRNVLFEARLAGNGSVSCAGCHVDGEHDLLSWDLGDPHGRLTRLPAQPDLPELPRHAAPAWDLHPMKGPMVTQTLRGLATNAPYHWRGDKATLEDFNGAFESLLGGHRIPATEMSQFARYMELIAHGPNPNQTLDRQYDPSAQRGERTFHQTPAIRFPDQTVVQCATCHSQADGANARIFVPSPAAFIGATQPTNVPQLRGLWRRGSTPVVGLPSKVGFGFAHDGMFPSLRAFVDLNVFNLTPTVEKDDLAHFLESFDSGTAPAVGYQVGVDAFSVTQPATVAALDLLEARARVGDIDLVVRGHVDGLPRGLLFEPATELYLGDAAGFGPFIRAQIETAIQTGHVRAHFRGVPPGSGPRLAFDADLDGQRDGEDGRRLVGTPVVGIRGHLLLNANREPRLGESEFAVVTTAAPDTVQGVLVVSSAAANLTISGVPVRVDLNASAPLIQPFWSDAAGLAFLRTPIPANPALIGLTLNLQAFFPDAATPVGVSASNGLEITIQPN